MSPSNLGKSPKSKTNTQTPCFDVQADMNFTSLAKKKTSMSIKQDLKPPECEPTKSTMVTHADDELRKYKTLYDHVLQREKKMTEFLNTRGSNIEGSKRFYQI